LQSSGLPALRLIQRLICQRLVVLAEAKIHRFFDFAVAHVPTSLRMTKGWIAENGVIGNESPRSSTSPSYWRDRRHRATSPGSGKAAIIRLNPR
jgi:hypothetical protein